MLATTDCGKTFTSIYKKYGTQLQTLGGLNSKYLSEFFPTNTLWRTDSIDVTVLLGAANSVRFAFKNITNHENNILLIM